MENYIILTSFLSGFDKFSLKRRGLLRLGGLTIGAALILACEGSFGMKEKEHPKPELTPKQAPLIEYLSADAISDYKLQCLAGLPAKVYEVPVADGRFTAIFSYDPNLRVRPARFQTAYDFLVEGNLAKPATNPVPRPGMPSRFYLFRLNEALYNLLPGDGLVLT